MMGHDTHALMRFEANKKSTGAAYLLWLFFGGFGGHRFYLGHVPSAVLMLALTMIGVATSVIGVGALFLAMTGLWALIDAFMIPGMVRAHNNALIDAAGTALRDQPTSQTEPFLQRSRAPEEKNEKRLEVFESQRGPSLTSARRPFGRRGA
jgi:TM2 domain-containing membrane protein YozV